MAEQAKDTNKKPVQKERKKRNFGKRFVSFFKGIISELKKVTWPKAKTVISSTGVVLVVVLVFLVIIFGIDYGLSELLKLLVGKSA
ncbi:MAG TPA: preprotein translocase subunit SecE [Eubacteriales bacterium]|jgi:preprotein translocase subunit SecE|nr:preprotein translocase subunit SecE [Eubacteriales bacterium]HRU84900.1 preprotein translocase subunit SecE [Eubacteriales bacterium]